MSQEFLNAWHSTIEKKDLKLMDPWVTDEVTLISPALFKPKVGRQEVTAVLKDVLASLENYTISKTWIDGNEILIEFDANVGNRKLQGIDKITLNADGKMTQLKVFIRPYHGLEALINSVVKMQIGRIPGVRGALAKLSYWIRS